MKTRLFFVLLLSLALLNSSFTQAGAEIAPILEPEVGWSAPSPASLPPLENISAIESGMYYTCALTTDGEVKCWGSNYNGQLGDGTMTNRSAPVTVSGLETGVAAIAVGGYHTCALTTSGGVKCWGSNSNGQLGDGTMTDRSTPVDVVGLASGVVAITADSSHTCALTTEGGAKCWGSNTAGLLGDGTVTGRRTPVDVIGLGSGVAAITAGSGHTCALTTGGGVQCWGSNQSGALGDGTTIDRYEPVDVIGMEDGVATVSAGSGHTCALTLEGGAKCWGINGYGQIGDGTTTDRSTPVDVSELGSGVGTILAGRYHTCALTTTGVAQCWGANWSGKLGDGTLIDRSTPVTVSGLESVLVDIALGEYHTCGLTTHGRVKCWGENQVGQLGNGTMPDISTTPVAVSGLGSGVENVVAGSNHNCVMTTGDRAQCWGDNWSGQLGDGTEINRSTPVDVSGLTSEVVAFTAGEYHTCGLTTAGGVKCWGFNEFGQLGDGTTTDRSSPVDVIDLSSGVAAIAAGNRHTCALTTAGGVKCWGFNELGQLGDGTTIDRSTPVAVSGLENGVAAVAAGGAHTCALTTGGGVMCWGDNWYGELGDGTNTNSSTPAAVNGLGSGVTAIFAGWANTCALTTNAEVMCWGSNIYGQLGDGTTINRSAPVAISVLNGEAMAISAGMTHICALNTSGGVQCCGANWYGQLGDGTTINRSTPVAVSGMQSGVAAVTTGEFHTCALTTDGEVRCWGRNREGQLGDGSILWSGTPVDVITLLRFFLPLVFRY